MQKSIKMCGKLLVVIFIMLIIIGIAYKHLGNIKWLSNNEVVLLNQDGEIYWREYIDNSSNSEDTKNEEDECLIECEDINVAEEVEEDKLETYEINKDAEEEFWNIISMFNWRYEGDDEKVLKPAIKYLSKKSDDEIFEFYEILSKLLYDLDGIEYAKNIGEDSYINDSEYFSVDDFLYARCCAVANGKDYYYNVLNHPEDMPKDLEFESILYVADEAYELKNGEEFDYLSKYSIETFSNKEKWMNE